MAWGRFVGQTEPTDWTRVPDAVYGSSPVWVAHAVCTPDWPHAVLILEVVTCRAWTGPSPIHHMQCVGLGPGAICAAYSMRASLGHILHAVHWSNLSSMGSTAVHLIRLCRPDPALRPHL